MIKNNLISLIILANPILTGRIQTIRFKRKFSKKMYKCIIALYNNNHHKRNKEISFQ